MKRIGKGWRDERRPHIKRHVLRLDEETFDQVRALAVFSNCSLSEQFRVLIETGLQEFKNAGI
jgi:hypothetical protein